MPKTAPYSGFFTILEQGEKLEDGAKRALAHWKRRNPATDATHVFVSHKLSPAPDRPIIEGLGIHTVKVGSGIVGAGVLA